MERVTEFMLADESEGGSDSVGDVTRERGREQERERE